MSINKTTHIKSMSIFAAGRRSKYDEALFQCFSDIAYEPTLISYQMTHRVSQTVWQKSKDRECVRGRISFPEDTGRDTSDISSPSSFSCIWNFRATRLRPVRQAAPIPEAREIALRAQTVVSIAALLIIAICHKFWVIVTAYRSRGFIRGTVVCEAVGGRATMLLNIRRNRAAEGSCG